MITVYQKVTDYFTESYKELRKVIWPSRQETLRYTLLVIAVSLGVALVLGGFDILFSYLVKYLISIKHAV